MLPAQKIQPTDAEVAQARGYASSKGFDPDAIEALMREETEMWMNDRYVASGRRVPEGYLIELSIRRRDRKPDIPWRHLQRIKNECAGDEVEAMELFPAEARLVDSANQRWLWLLKPGLRFPVGFDMGRVIAGPAEAAEFGAVQAAHEEVGS